MSEEQAEYDEKLERVREAAEKLSPRQRALVSGVFEGKTQAQAARDAGYPVAAARQMASRELSQGDVRSLMRAIYDLNGMTDEDLARKNRELLDAKAYGLTRDGRVKELGPDAHAQIKALELATKVRDRFPNPKFDVEHNVRGSVVILRESDVLGSDLYSDAIDGETRELTDTAGN